MKRSKAELKKLLEAAVREECDLAPGLWFCVDEVVAHGKPPHRIEAWATLHFTDGGTPYCCGETECHMDLIRRQSAVHDNIRRRMGLLQEVIVDFGEHHERIGASFGKNVRFIHVPPYAQQGGQPDAFGAGYL